MKKLLLPLFAIVLLITGCTITVDVDVDEDVDEDIVYAIAFESNGGTEIEIALIENENGLIEPIEPTKVDHVFLGWYLDENFTDEVDFPVVPLLDLILYAKWDFIGIIEYDITFETNGGTEIDSIVVVQDSPISRPVDPVREGYFFEGWYTDSNFTSDVRFSTNPSSDLTLYAKWNMYYTGYFNESNPVVTIVVEGLGTMTLQLFPSVAPNTVNNFIMYIENGDFTDNSFHRIIEDFMIQGGNTYSTTCPINGDFEINGFTNDLSHFRGVISMARTNVKDSATSQFFIVHQDSFFLDDSYATFGGLVTGFDILDSIAEVSTTYGNVPIQTVVIESITIELNGYLASAPTCAD